MYKNITYIWKYMELKINLEGYDYLSELVSYNQKNRQKATT